MSPKILDISNTWQLNFSFMPIALDPVGPAANSCKQLVEGWHSSQSCSVLVFKSRACPVYSLHWTVSSPAQNLAPVSALGSTSCSQLQLTIFPPSLPDLSFDFLLYFLLGNSRCQCHWPAFPCWATVLSSDRHLASLATVLRRLLGAWWTPVQLQARLPGKVEDDLTFEIKYVMKYDFKW